MTTAGAACLTMGAKEYCTSARLWYGLLLRGGRREPDGQQHGCRDKGTKRSVKNYAVGFQWLVLKPDI